MKEVTIKINPTSFPNQFASDKEKQSLEYGLQIMQSVQYEWFRKDTGNCKFYNQWGDFHRLRLYARGEQSIAKYKNERLKKTKMVIPFNRRNFNIFYN